MSRTSNTAIIYKSPVPLAISTSQSRLNQKCHGENKPLSTRYPLPILKATKYFKNGATIILDPFPSSSTNP